MCVAPIERMALVERIVVATDFSACSREAVTLAVELALRFNASLTLVHVWEIPPSAGLEYAASDYVSELVDASQAQLDRELQNVKAILPTAEAELRSGIAAEGIIEAAKARRADLIVVGSHGRTGLKRALLGSVAEKVVRWSTLPVLTVRHPHEHAHTTTMSQTA